MKQSEFLSNSSCTDQIHSAECELSAFIAGVAETIDPAKVAQVILHLATKEQRPAHLLLGSDAVHYARLADDKRESDAKVWLDVSVLTDAEGARGQPALNL